MLVGWFFNLFLLCVGQFRVRLWAELEVRGGGGGSYDLYSKSVSSPGVQAVRRNYRLPYQM